MDITGEEGGEPHKMRVKTVNYLHEAKGTRTNSEEVEQLERQEQKNLQKASVSMTDSGKNQKLVN